MQELTYEQYKEAGGSSDHSTFLLMRTDCETELEAQTFGKINRLEELEEKTIRLMVRIIDEILLPGDEKDTAPKNSEGVTSYSNGFESITFGEANTPEGKQKRVRALCLKYLPAELTYRGVKC